MCTFKTTLRIGLPPPENGICEAGPTTDRPTNRRFCIFRQSGIGGSRYLIRHHIRTNSGFSQRSNIGDGGGLFVGRKCRRKKCLKREGKKYVRIIATGEYVGESIIVRSNISLFLFCLPFLYSVRAPVYLIREEEEENTG